MERGLIFDINEFAVHDGPGIRTSVFLKGCPLRCTWCHNPEGQSFSQELIVSNMGCLKCGKCKAVCKNERCAACGSCISVCPMNLRRYAATEWASADLCSRLLKNKDFFGENGGFTFSGGEPLAQPGFLFEVISGLKPLHVTIETSGFAPLEIFSAALGVADLIIMDAKHMNSEAHKKHTGVSNELILENMKMLLESRHPCIIRIPVIPGVNDNIRNMENTADFVKGYEGLQRVELLAYHKTAAAKYALVRKDFLFSYEGEAKNPEIFRSIFESRGISVFVP